MYFLEIALIGIGLAMDAFAVSISNGIRAKEIKIGYPLKIALFFGIFQAVMPVIGWLIGISLKNLISSVDHWIAFILLCVVGINMIRDSFKIQDKNQPMAIRNKALIMQSVATSIDALIIGASLAFLKFPIIISAILIGLITFSFSFCGIYIGKKCGCILEKKAEIAGGLILIGIGTKILIEHLLK